MVQVGDVDEASAPGRENTLQGGGAGEVLPSSGLLSSSVEGGGGQSSIWASPAAGTMLGNEEMGPAQSHGLLGSSSSFLVLLLALVLVQGQIFGIPGSESLPGGLAGDGGHYRPGILFLFIFRSGDSIWANWQRVKGKYEG